MKQFLLLLSMYILSGHIARAQDTVPDFTLIDTDGNSWNLYSQLAMGKTVLLDFFFADCTPCQQLTPQVAQLYEDYGAGTGDVLVLGISDRDNNTYLAQFDQTYGVNYPTGGIEGNGDQITSLYSSYYSFFGWPLYAVVCSDTSMVWNISPQGDSLPQIRQVIDSCTQSVAATIGAWKPASSDISIYTDPGNGILIFQINKYFDEPLTISIFDITGASIGEKELPAGTTGVIHSPGHLKSGIYIVNINSKKRNIHRQKIILQ